MGEVFHAQEHATGRNVAMKFVRSNGSRLAMERFLVEVRALSAVDHPNIIRVLSTDFLRSDPFFTMELAEGGSLGKWIEKNGPPTPAVAAHLMADVARAVAAAHAKGILHRDLKPSNILLGADTGHRTADADSSFPHTPHASLSLFRPKVSDFGLAKRIDHDDFVTLGSGPLGTPGFMPPEQISKRNGEVGPASDVYGIGATLYHVLTGRAPFANGDHSSVMEHVLTDPVPRPRSRRAEIPADLDGIVVKCLEKDPEHRYPTATALAEDLERFLTGQKPAAPAMTGWRRTRRWLGRNRKRIATASAALLLAVGLVASGLAIAPRAKTTDEELAEIQRGLDADKTIVLVGPTGKPQWHQWAVSEGTLAPSASRDGTYDLQSHGLTFLELLPDPRHDRYRLTAELRHVGGNRGGVCAVGLYVGFETVVSKTGNSVSPVLLAWYEDVFTASDSKKLGKREPVEHIARLEFATALSQFNCYPVMRHHGSNGEPGLVFEPRQQNPVPWRTIVLNVSPDGVEMFWGTNGGPLVLAHRVTAHDCFVDRQEVRADVNDGRLGVLLGDKAAAIPAWHPRRGLGIWAQQSTVSIRNVIIQPNP